MSAVTPPAIMRIMSLSLSTAKRAGGIIRDVLEKGNLGIVDKGKDDLQTEADRTAQQCIIGSLSRQFPCVKIIGEEGGSDLNIPLDMLVTEPDADFLEKTCPAEFTDIKDEDFVIWVDPLDGTSEYTQGYLENVTVLIGIAVKNAAVGGIIHQPYYKHPSGDLGRTIWGLKELGVGGFQPASPPEGQFIVTTTRSHFNALVQSALDALSPTVVLRVGGAGFKVLQLLEGKAHAYVFASAGCKKWDTCAPEAVLEAYGGTLTDISGQHYAYHQKVEFANRRGVVATGKGVDHKKLIDKIPSSLQDEMSK